MIPFRIQVGLAVFIFWLALRRAWAAEITTVPLTTTRITNASGPQRFEPIATPCPECGGSNHHQVKISGWVAFDLLTVRITVEGVSQTNFVRGMMTNWFTTNLVPITLQGRVQPGWQASPPPLMPNTNR